MTNWIFNTLLSEQITIFKSSFSAVSRQAFYDPEHGRLIHPGEFGMYREAICRDFLRFLVPRRLEFDTGFIINASNEVSSQCDIVIFDAASTPLIQSGARQRFFPIETVCAVGEVKSVLSKSELRNALQKLNRVKAMRENIPNPVILSPNHRGPYNPQSDPYDQVFTFLICEKFDFDMAAQDFHEFYSSDSLYGHHHNMILSVEDGILLYYDWNGKTMMYPYVGGQQLKHRFIRPDSDPNIHLKYFATYLFLSTSSNTILYPEMTDYIGDLTGGIKYSEP